WSLGVILYEMLTGRRPAAAAEPGGGVAPPSTLRPGVPGSIDALVLRLLAYDRDARPAGAADVLRVLERASAPATAIGGVTGFVRDHPTLSVTASLGAVVLAFAAGFFALRALGPTPAAAEPLATRVERLAAQGRFVEAFALAVEAEQEGPAADALPHHVWYQIADWISVTTEPAGARVLAVRYAPERAAIGDTLDWRVLGTTPLDSARVPRGDYILRVERDGYAPAERSASSALERVMPAASLFPHRIVATREWEEQGSDTELRFHIQLVPEGHAPPDMVFVPGGPYQLVSQDVEGQRVELAEFLLDRFEVTNAQFAEFVRAGGYASAENWHDLVADAGDDAPNVLAGLTDRTGLPSPRNWTGQLYAGELADHPVTGVTWYEAAAYCRFRGRRLPTLFEWEKAARAGLISRFDGRIMPWGYHTQRAGLRLRANFSSAGTEPVDAHPFGMSPYGAHGMAGNAKEWVSNTSGGGRMFAGGSWEDPIYVFGQVGSIDPLTASPALGFRCATLAEPGAPGSMDSSPQRGEPGSGVVADAMAQGDGVIELDTPMPVYEPVDAQTFQTLLDYYRYDPLRLDAEVIETVETPGWVRQKVAFNGPAGPAGSRILAYLYLPRAGKPPYQTLIVTPGAGAFLGNTLAFETEWVLAPLIRAGRAAFSVVMSGMTEREWGAGYRMPESNSVAFRDLMVLQATELRIGLDYLETRPEIDTTAIAYVGVSMGAGSRLPWAAVDNRFDAVVLVGGGIDERVHPTLPEASNINFAPYIRAPKLLLNGRNDEDHRWESRARPLWDLLTEPKDLVLVEGAGHLVPPEQRIPAMVEWLDRTLGPVRH
ncbi:MAG: SUMF1/EgtB/PvdO family nonheme iron enzyme, partial [Longimicrobiales bacterium]